MSPAHSLTLSLASQVWSDLADRVEAFVAAWERNPAEASIADYVPDEPLAVRRMVLVELVKIDLEQRWQANLSRKLLEAYGDEFPELVDAEGIPGDLIYEEFHVRKQAGDDVSASEYLRRFPKQAEEVERLLGADSQFRSTQLVKGQEPTTFEVGDRVEEFDLLAPLGTGAFATVYLARQATMQRIVALKISADRGDEPQTLAQLDHPNIVRVYDQRQLTDRGVRLLYMQHVPGGTLQSVIAAVGHIPIEKRTGRDYLAAVDRMLERTGHEIPHDSAFRERLKGASWHDVVCLVGSRIADALVYAHEKGVLHRDIKPANVLVAADGSPKLADFNVSYGSNVEGATPEAFFGGSLSYMSPEQIEVMNPVGKRTAETVGEQSDVYSLGVLLWEFLHGERPLGDEPMAANWIKTLTDMIRRRNEWIHNPTGTKAKIPLIEVLGSCLSPETTVRFNKAADVAQELELCLKPETRKLLEGPGSGWKRRVAAMPVVAVLVATLVPNIFAALFNYQYNRHEIVEMLPTSDSLTLFERIQFVINAIAFPMGLLFAVWLVRPLSRALAKIRDGGTVASSEVKQLRERVLRLGTYAAGISVAEWLIAGAAYPISLRVLAGTLPAATYFHFLASLAVCGLIAGAYPFFGVTFLGTRIFYPALLRANMRAANDRPLLIKLSQSTTLFLATAAAVPLVGIALLVAISSSNRLALWILSAGGVTLLGLALLLYREIQRDIGLLVNISGTSHEQEQPAELFGASAWNA